MATSTKRSRQIKITVTPELFGKLSDLASAYGQPPSTLASVLLGQVVANQLNGLQAGQRMGDALAAQMGDTIKESIRELAK
jgi:hypothetical protein